MIKFHRTVLNRYTIAQNGKLQRENNINTTSRKHKNNVREMLEKCKTNIQFRHIIENMMGHVCDVSLVHKS